MPRRQIILIAVLLVLGAGLALDSLGAFDASTDDADETAVREHLLSDIEHLNGYALAASEISAEYDRTFLSYAEGISAASGLMLDPGSPSAFAEDMVRRRLSGGGTYDLAVTAGEAVSMGGGVHEILLSVEFKSHSDRRAVQGVIDLGRAEAGTVWDDLSLTGDAAAKTVLVSGRLRALIIEAAEQ